LPDESFLPYANDLYNGVFFGYASVNLPDEAQNPVSRNIGEKEEHEKVWPMVMSVGWNPYFKNEKKTAVSISVRFVDQTRDRFY
jgi:riboflavin kinase